MQKFNEPLITDVGRKLLIELGKSKGTIVYTKAVLYGQAIRNLDAEAMRKLTSLSDPKKEASIGIRDADTSDDTVSIEASFSNEDLKDDITFNSLGWFAKREDQQGKPSQEILLAVTSTVQPEVLAAGSPNHLSNASIDIELDMALSNAAKVELTVNQAGIIHKSDLDNAINDLNKGFTQRVDGVSSSLAQKDKDRQAQINQVKTDLEQKISDERNRTYSKQEVDTKVAQAGKVKTVNNIQPDNEGNIYIDPPVSVVKNYNFDNGNSTSEFLDLSKSHVLGLDVLRQIKAKLDSVKTELDKKINDSVTSQLDGKASKTDLDNIKNDLTNKINSKASQTDFNALSKSVVKSINNVHPDQRGNIAFTQYGGASVQYPITNDTYSKLFQELNVPVTGKIFIPDLNAILNIVQSIAVNSVSLDYASDELDKTNTKVELNTKNITEINSAWGRYNHDSAVNLLSLWGQFGIHYVKNNGNTNTPSFISDKRGTVFVLTFDGNSQTMFFIGALGGFAYYNKLNNKWVQISTADDLKGVKDSLDQQIKATNEQVKAANTKIDSNTNRITALEKKETSHISANETDALNYSKAHPGIPVFVAE